MKGHDMLPAVKRAAIFSLTALAIAATPAAPALAWGDREQGVVTGVLGTLLVQGMIREGKKYHRQPEYAAPRPQPVYVEPDYYQPRATTSIYRTPAARAFNSYSSKERRMIQRRLSAMGYYRGGVDGSFGPGTYSAIAAYADDEGMSGYLSSTSDAYGVMDSLIY
jgi:DNA gyrase/topoisomerase IV subunit B